MLICVSILILSVPFAVATVAELPNDFFVLAKWDGESEFFGNYYNPFVNPGNFNERTVSQVILSILGIILFSGLLVSLLVNFLEQRATRWRKGELHYNFGVGLQYLLFKKLGIDRSYCVVIGNHESAPGLIKKLVKEYDRIIVFSSSDIEKYRQEIESIQEIYLQKEKIVFYYGKRDSESDLKHLDIHSSYLKEVFILGEKTEDGEPEEAHDAINMRCVELLSAMRNNSIKLRCYVFFEHQSTSILFQKNDIDSSIRNNINLIAFNLYELWAQKVFANEINSSYHGQFPLNKRDVNDSLDPSFDYHAHLVIIGMTKVGVALALEAARSCHYPNFAAAQMLAEFGDITDWNKALNQMANRRTRITIIDANASNQERSFRARHPQVFDFYRCKSAKSSTWTEPLMQDEKSKVFTDVEFEFIEANIESKEAYDFINNAINDEKSLVTIASCITSTSKALAAMMYLPIPQEKMHRINRLIFQPLEASLVGTLSKEIIPFGMVSETIDLEYIRTIEKRAKRINYIWKTKDDNKLQEKISAADKNREKNIILENDIDIVWESQIEPSRWASRYQASSLSQRVLWSGFDKLGTSVLNKDATLWFDGIMERTEHNRWLMAKLLLSSSEKIEEESTESKTTLLSYRLLYDRSNKSLHKKYYQDLLGYTKDENNKRLTNDQRMIKNTRWIMS